MFVACQHQKTGCWSIGGGDCGTNRQNDQYMQIVDIGRAEQQQHIIAQQQNTAHAPNHNDQRHPGHQVKCVLESRRVALKIQAWHTPGPEGVDTTSSQSKCVREACCHEISSGSEWIEQQTDQKDFQMLVRRFHDRSQPQTNRTGGPLRHIIFRLRRTNVCAHLLQGDVGLRHNHNEQSNSENRQNFGGVNKPPKHKADCKKGDRQTAPCQFIMGIAYLDTDNRPGRMGAE